MENIKQESTNLKYLINTSWNKYELEMKRTNKQIMNAENYLTKSGYF